MLVLCVPLLCFNVSADDIILYPSVETVHSTDFSSLPKHYSASSSRLNQVCSSFTEISQSEYNDLQFPYWNLSSSGSYYKTDISNVNNALNVFFYKYSNPSLFSDGDLIYYYAYFSKVSDSEYILMCYLSPSFLYFKTTDNINYRIYSDSSIVYCSLTFRKNSSGKVSSSISGETITDSNLSYFYFNSDCTSYLNASSFCRTWTANNTVYTPSVFIVPFNLGNFPNFLSNASQDGVHYVGFGDGGVTDYEKSLNDLIDVKLTPEFTIGMDRVFDKNTGQNDYFKFEVTNNSDSNIQFCASIVDEQKESFKNAISGTIFDGILQFDYKDWEEGYWNYISDSQYYADCYEVEEELFGLAHDYKRYAELRKGNFYWVILKPGEKFEDFIYWENVNIKANTKYSFIVDAVPTELDYPTDVFYALDELTGVKVFSHNEDLDDRQYSKDESLEKYALDKNECVQVCNHVFSVKSIPEFTTEIKGGNSKITSGWHDTVKQSTNPYYREDTRNGEIKAVNNYSEYNGNLPDVDVNIDNLSVDNIKSYVSYSQDFFKVIKSVLCVFPSWVWVLICFGLTGLIVIAIVKALL